MQRGTFDDLRDRKPTQRSVLHEALGRTQTQRTARKRVYDDSSDSSDDYVALGKKLTSKYKVEKIPRMAKEKFTKGYDREEDLTDYEALKKKMEQRSRMPSHNSFNSFYNDYAN